MRGKWGEEVTGRMQAAAAGRMVRSSCEFLQVRCEMTYVLQATMTRKNRECSMGRGSKRKGCTKRSMRDSKREREGERGRDTIAKSAVAACIKNLKRSP